MAVFPDRIVFKTSRDSAQEILDATSTNGESPIVDGEIVLGLEAGKVKLYAKDSTGQVISVLPDPPGYNISGNSIYDLSDVVLSTDYTPENYKVLTYRDGAWVADVINWSNIVDAPTSLLDFTNPGDYYLSKQSELSDLNDVGNSVGTSALTGGEYLQFDAGTSKWEAVESISFDISSSSIFQLYDVSNSPPPTASRAYLIWNVDNEQYEPAQLDISIDTTPALGGNLEYGGRNFYGIDLPQFVSTNAVQPSFKLTQGRSRSEDPPNQHISIHFDNDMEYGPQNTYLGSSPNPEIVFDSSEEAFVYEDVYIYLPGRPAVDGTVLKFDGQGASDWVDFAVDELNDVEIDQTTLVTGSVLAYDFNTQKWKNQPAPPADISGNSLGQLSDVNYGTSGDLIIDELNSIHFTGSRVPDVDLNLINSGTNGFQFSQFRASDGLGSYLYVHRDNGIELQTSSSMVRLTGDPLVTENQPTLRWERMDYVANPLVAPYVSLKLGEAHDHQITYVWPTVEPEAGQALFSDVEGNLTWGDVVIDLDGSINLGELGDVDLTTPVPLEGMVLTYTGDAAVGWVAQYPPEQVGRLSELQDVDLADLSNQDFLRWNSGTARWEPSEGPEKDWMIESVVQFFSDFNSTVSGTIPVGTWAVNSPLPTNSTELTVSKYTATGTNLSSQMDSVFDVGRQLIFESQAEDATYLLATITEVLSSSAGQMSFSITLDDIAGSFQLNERFTCSLVGGGGSGGGGTASSMEDLEDTDFLSINLNDKSILEWDKPTGFWREGAPVPRDLDDLETVDLNTNLPQVGENLIWNGANWVPGSGGGGGGGVNAKATDRVELNATAGGVAPGADSQLTVTSLGSSGNFLSIEVDKACWVRCYSSLAAMGLDASRGQETDPALGDGVLLEFISAGPSSTNITPGTVYFNSEFGANNQNNIYFAVRNLGEEEEDIALKVVAYAAVVTSLSKGRTTVSDITPPLAPGETHLGSIEGTGKMGSFLSVQTSAPAWVTFYTSTESRDNDLTRDRNTTPSTSSGVLLELIAQANTIYEVTPQRGYFNNDAIPQDKIYYKVVSEASSQQAITVQTSLVPLEGQILNAITGTITTINGGTFG